jgi:deoxyribodipyrimidine photo-lyase
MKDHFSVFIFRRDLRIVDNLALNEVYTSYPNVPILPIFIFNPLQIDPNKNKYYNDAAVEFMIESLNDLNDQTKGALHCFHGDDIDILNRLMKQVTIQCIAYNRDFTPFAIQRDENVATFCADHNIPLITKGDYTLYDFTIKTDTGKAYEVYTPFYRKCLDNIQKVQKPSDLSKSLRFYNQTNSATKINGRIKVLSKYIHSYVPKRTIKGGRPRALEILKRIEAKEYKDYDKDRDYPALDKTTKLSSYLKFGCISIREAFYCCLKTYGMQHGLIRELIWREFYTNITYYFPHVLNGHSMKRKYDAIKWTYNDTLFQAWCNGKTGYPIIDAAMICMNNTGYMHNRLRMIVASFLTKDLLQDWRWGEMYFAKKLVDYDPSSNNGGWQWAGSTGADSQPYFRIFNPWTQSEKFDKDCIFIRRWIPALANVPCKSIHEWYKDFTRFKVAYPAPVVDHKIASKKALELYSI